MIAQHAHRRVAVKKLNMLQWDCVSVPVQAKTKRLQKISPLLVFWSVGLGIKFL
jgi:hypothetical protein